MFDIDTLSISTGSIFKSSVLFSITSSMNLTSMLDNVSIQNSQLISCDRFIELNGISIPT